MQPANRLSNIQEYYFSHKMREIAHLIEKGKPVVNLGIGNPDLPPPTTVMQAMKKATSDVSKHGYQPYKGLPELREAMAFFYDKHYQVSLNPETEILPLAGTKEGIMHISMAYLNEGDAVLIPNPGYATYETITKMLGATPLAYSLNDENNWQPNLKELEKHDLSKVKIMWINYPNMPTGAKASSELFKGLIAFTQRHDILLVNDNPYSFILNKHPMSILASNEPIDHVIELNSLSKSFNMAGWRIGMLVGAKKHIDNVLKVKSNMDSGMYYGLQKGAIAALQMEKDWFSKLNAIYKKRRKLVREIAELLNCTYEKKAQGFFVWAKLPTGIDDKEISDQLLKDKSVFIAPGSIFGSNGKGYLRFSLCVDKKVLNEVFERLK